MSEWDRLYKQSQRIKEQYPVGTRIMLMHMGQDIRRIEDGTKGTVRLVDDIGTLFCNFDNGRRLGIIPEEDSFRKLTREELLEEQSEKTSQETTAHTMEDHNTIQTTPLYRYPYSYAVENGEIAAYRDSYTANVACKEAIEKSIVQHYHSYVLDREAVNQVVEQFGFDRTLYVLANTVRYKDWDGRFSHDNKEWAKHIVTLDDQSYRFVVDRSHPVLTNSFLNMVRDEYQRSTQRDVKNAAESGAKPPLDEMIQSAQGKNANSEETQQATVNEPLK